MAYSCQKAILIHALADWRTETFMNGSERGRKMKKVIKSGIILAVAVILCISAAGCGLLKEAVIRNREGKEPCTVNQENASAFYMGNAEYTILEDTVGRQQLGDWVGYFQKYVYLNDKNQVVMETEIEASLTEIPELSELAEEMPESADCVIAFMNVFRMKDSQTDDMVIINVGDGFHTAVRNPDDLQKSKIISFHREKDGSGYDWEVNPKNCRELVTGKQIYEITDIQVPDASQGKYLGKLDDQYLLDDNSGRVIPREELMVIEPVPGRISGQQRINWHYGEIYSLPGEKEEKAVAVKINDQFLKAVIKEK